MISPRQTQSSKILYGLRNGAAAVGSIRRWVADELYLERTGAVQPTWYRQTQRSLVVYKIIT